MATDDRDLLFRAQRLVDGGSPMADTLFENASLRTRIAALESQLAQFRWRRVEEEMPEAQAYVLTFDCGYLTEAYVDDEGVWWERVFDTTIDGVKHWMPLPPAPQEE